VTVFEILIPPLLTVPAPDHPANIPADNSPHPAPTAGGVSPMSAIRPKADCPLSALYDASVTPSCRSKAAGQTSKKGDGVDAPRRHLRAKVTVSNCHRRRRP
jgi:hypothetical protein